MQPPKQDLWINLVVVKGQLVKKIGMERSNRYFDYLNRFLSLKLSKSEFDKLCLGTIGKDNIRLHNQLIRAVLKNACAVVTHVTSLLNLANGDVLPPSPRKARAGGSDRRVVERKSALGSNGYNTNFSPFSSSTPDRGDLRVVAENGESSSPNHQELMKQAEYGALVSVDGKFITDRTSLYAPLGVPHFPITIGGTHIGNNSKRVGVLHTDSLLDTATLKERMEQITKLHGFQQVSMDCANVLNKGLDVYLNGLIRSCVELNGSRSRSSIHKLTQNKSLKHPDQIRSLNGVWPGQQEPKLKRLVNLLDFRVAMELNCKQLGDDWPILREKICCTHDFEE